MKNPRLIAHIPLIAALAAATAVAPAAAQSSVVIFGRVDLSVTKQNSGTSGLNGTNGRLGTAGNRWDLRPGSAGRIGFRGSEDLGSGLKASFLMEHRFNPDTGEPLTPFWQARSFVELSSVVAGTVYLGREYIPAFWPALRLDPWGFDSVGTLGPKHQFALYTVDGGIRTNNTLGYKTPRFAGLTANLAVAAGEGGRKRAVGGNVEYRQGAVYIGAGFDRVDSGSALALIGAAYDFKVVRPAITFVKSTVAGLDHTNISLAATAPVGNGLLKLAVAKLDPDGANNDSTRLGVGYEHYLSKRTSLMANLGSGKQQGSLAGVARTRTTVYEFGMKHNF